MQRCLRILALGLLTGLLTAAFANAECDVDFVNPLTDISWGCINPIRLAGTTISNDGPDPEAHVSSPLCSCDDGAMTRVGVITGFREPARMVDVVKDAWCFAGLGIDMGGSVWDDGGIDEERSNESATTTYTAHTHSYFYNPLFILELMLDSKCLEKMPVGISDMSEVRPDHKDEVLNNMIYPETLLFANPVAQLSCMADAVGATAGWSLDALFWCAGSWGTVYPMTAYSMNQHSSYVEAAANVASKSISRSHRNLMLWGTKGVEALCGAYPQPVWKKTQYKLQPMRPTKTRTCPPIGRSGLLWDQGVNSPAPGRTDQFVFELWRYKDCCSF